MKTIIDIPQDFTGTYNLIFGFSSETRKTHPIGAQLCDHRNDGYSLFRTFSGYEKEDNAPIDATSCRAVSIADLQSYFEQNPTQTLLEIQAHDNWPKEQFEAFFIEALPFHNGILQGYFSFCFITKDLTGMADVPIPRNYYQPSGIELTDKTESDLARTSYMFLTDLRETETHQLLREMGERVTICLYYIKGEDDSWVTVKLSTNEKEGVQELLSHRALFLEANQLLAV